MIESPIVEPVDDWNQKLIGNVHPSDWKNPVPSGRYNLVVVGAGTAGLVTAAGAAGLGAKVALIERHLLGGDCLNFGCVPSKCFIRSSRALVDVYRAPEFGVTLPGDPKVDFAGVMERMRRIRQDISAHDSAQRFSELGVDVYFGNGMFTGARTLEVDGVSLSFSKAVIATGARAYCPDLDGLETAGYLTNETVFSLTERPHRIAVLGGGPLGCELAQAFNRLGSHVYLIEKSDQILVREDPDAARIVQEVFTAEGVDLMLKATVHDVYLSDGGKVLHLQTGAKKEMIEVDEILIGAGRVPNVNGLGLDNAGVDYDERLGIKVNDNLRTTNRRIFAAGDICMQHKFTHMADAAARIVIQNALFWGRKKLSSVTVPWCTYTDPEIAHVGMYERDSVERNIQIDTFVRHLKDVDRAVTDGDEHGFVKIHVRKGSDSIVGATIVARHAGEMISEISTAMAGGVGLGSLAGVIHPYPTQAEAIRQVGDEYNRTRLTPFVRGLFERLLAWKR